MRYLLDTDTCADVLRGQREVIGRLRSIPPDDVAVSSISSYELFTGVEKCRNPDRERKKLEVFLDTLHEVPFLAAAARTAARVRAHLESRGCPIGPYDTLLAGQALASDLVLVTSNVDEFARVPDLRVESWRQP